MLSKNSIWNVSNVMLYQKFLDTLFPKETTKKDVISRVKLIYNYNFLLFLRICMYPKF